MTIRKAINRDPGVPETPPFVLLSSDIGKRFFDDLKSNKARPEMPGGLWFSVLVCGCDRIAREGLLDRWTCTADQMVFIDVDDFH